MIYDRLEDILMAIKADKLRALLRAAGKFVPPSGYEAAYNELREELKQCPVDAKKEP